MSNASSWDADIQKVICQSEEELFSLDEHLRAFSKAPVTLHHYTSTSGLYGIASQGVLHCTGVQHLNDSTEGEYGAELLKKVVGDSIGKCNQTSTEDVRFAVRTLQQIILLQYDELRNSAKHFVSCFCEDKDLLSQWRGYGQRGGYCINFDTHGLFFYMNHISPANDHVFAADNTREARLKKVVYKEETQHSVLDGALNIIITNYTNLLKNIELTGMNFLQAYGVNGTGGFARLIDEYANFAANKFLEYTARFKHPAFAEEREWRLVHKRGSSDLEGVKFRVASDRLIPYIECAFIKERAFESVTCGPPFSELAAQTTRDFLKSVGLGDKPVHNSYVPLR